MKSDGSLWNLWIWNGSTTTKSSFKKLEVEKSKAKPWTPKSTYGLFSDLLCFRVSAVLRIPNPPSPDHASHNKSKSPLCLDLSAFSGFYKTRDQKCSKRKMTSRGSILIFNQIRRDKKTDAGSQYLFSINTIVLLRVLQREGEREKGRKKEKERERERALL